MYEDGMNTTNSSYNTSTTPKPQARDRSFAEAFSHPKTAAMSTVLLLLMLLIIVGNLLIIRTVFVTRRLHFSAFYFVASLAVADVFVGAFLLPLSFTYIVMGAMKGGEWSFGPALCHSVLLCNFWFCGASILSLCVVSWDRFVAVTTPLFYRARMHSAKVRCLIAVVWVISLAMSVLISVAVASSDTVVYCTASGLALEFSLPSALCIFVLPLLFLIFANGKIMFIARAQMKKILMQMPASYSSLDSSEESSSKKYQEQKEGQSDSGDIRRASSITDNERKSETTYGVRERSQTLTSENSRSLFRRDRSDTKTSTRERETSLVKYFTNFKREVKTFKLFVVVTGFFVVCWTPLFVTMVITSFYNTVAMSTLMHNMLILGYANSACNVFIYGHFNRDFRRAVLSSLCRPCCCVSSRGVPQRVRSGNQRGFHSSSHIATAHAPSVTQRDSTPDHGMEHVPSVTQRDFDSTPDHGMEHVPSVAQRDFDSTPDHGMEHVPSVTQRYFDSTPDHGMEHAHTQTDKSLDTFL